MPPHRTLIAIVAAALVGVALFALNREDTTPPATGDLIAYSCTEQHNPWWAICTVSRDGADERRLTSKLPTTNPAWSPDGRYIAFTRNEDVGEYTTLSDDDVFVMDANGSHLKQLTPEREGVHAGQPAWSPDGRRIVFVRGDSVPTALIVRPGSLFVMNADGSDERRLTRGWLDVRPAWSPDGREIAFSRAKNFTSSRGIWVMEATGGRPRELTHTAGPLDGAPAWSPDGARIAFVRLTRDSPVNGRAAIYVVNRDGSHLQEILRYRLFEIFSYALTWSADGRTIAFETSPNRACTGISLINLKSRGVRPLIPCKKQKDSARSPAWEPDTSARQ
jgi:Tol biopolymer transport system component